MTQQGLSLIMSCLFAALLISVRAISFTDMSVVSVAYTSAHKWMAFIIHTSLLCANKQSETPLFRFDMCCCEVTHHWCALIHNGPNTLARPSQLDTCSLHPLCESIRWQINLGHSLLPLQGVGQGSNVGGPAGQPETLRHREQIWNGWRDMPCSKEL